MKTYIYRLFVLVFFSIAVFQVSQAQDNDLHEARKEFRNKDYYWAAFYSASALHSNELGDAQLKSAQKILRESYEGGIQLVEDFIARDQANHQKFQGDSTVAGRKRIIGDLESLAKLNDQLTSIPAAHLVAQTKKESDLSFEKIDYSVRIQAAKAGYEESLQLAAKLHYDAAIGLDQLTTVPDLVRAYREYASCLSFVAGYQDAASRQQQTGDRIGEMNYAQGEQEFAKGTMLNLESALKSYEHGLLYSKLPKLQEGKSKTVQVLSDLYYAKADHCLRGKEVAVSQTQTQTSAGSNPESMGLKMGIAPSSVVGKVVNALMDGGSPSTPTETVTTTTTTTRHEMASLDDHFEAMVWLRKLDKIHPGYKDSGQMMRQAEAGTQLHDSRNNRTYATFMVGKTIWMGENLDWDVSGSAYYYYVDRSGKTVTDYASGRYYTGTAVSQYKNNLCPFGWRLPSQREVQELIANYQVQEKVYGNLQFAKLGYGLRYGDTNYAGRSFSQSSHGSSGAWWLAESGLALTLISEFKVGNSAADTYHHCRCVKDQRPTE